VPIDDEAPHCSGGIVPFGVLQPDASFAHAGSGGASAHTESDQSYASSNPAPDPVEDPEDNLAEEASAAGYSAVEEPEDIQLSDEMPPEPAEPVVPDVEMQDAEFPKYPKRIRNPPVEWWRSTAARMNALAGLSDNPASYKEAMGRPDRDLWQQAIDEEFASLHQKQVYSEER